MAQDDSTIKLSEVQRLPRNPKTHDVEDIKASILRWGFIEPLVINERPDFTRVLLAGHGRVDTLLELKRDPNIYKIEGIFMDAHEEWHIPCRFVAVPVEDELAVATRLNKSSEKGGWDDELLLEILGELSAKNDLQASGFTQKDYENLDFLFKEYQNDTNSGTEALPDLAPESKELDLYDEIPLPPGATIEVQTGDLYRCGLNYLLCGDSTNREDLQKLFILVDGAIVMVWADPPYGQDYHSNMRTQWQSQEEKARFLVLRGDDKPLVDFMPLITHIPVWYVCCRWDVAPDFMSAISNSDFYLKNWIVWDKGDAGMGDLTNAYIFGHETILYAISEDRDKSKLLGRREADVWNVPKDPSSSYLHPTQKPVELVQKAFNQHLPTDGWAFDPFSGRGTSLVAAYRMGGGRKVIACELDPKYVQIALKFWEDETGIQPVKLVTKE